MSCAGVKLNGGARGEPCRAVAPYVYRGQHYCGPHYALVAFNGPVKAFKEAKDSYGRRLVRQEAAKRAAEKQIDMLSHMEGCRCPECDPDYNDPRYLEHH